MGDFNQAEYNEFLINNGIVGIFDKPVTLKSKRLSNWYVNHRITASKPSLLDTPYDSVIDFASDNELDVSCYYGVPEGATILGTLLQADENKFDKIFVEPGLSIDKTVLFKNSVSMLEFMRDSNLTVTESMTFYGSPFSPAREQSLIAQQIAYYQCGDKEFDQFCMGRRKTKDYGISSDRAFIGKPQGNMVLVSQPDNDSINLELNMLRGIEGVDVVGLFYFDLGDSAQPVKGPEELGLKFVEPLKEVRYWKKNPAELTLIEDVTTTGGSSLAEVLRLRKAGIRVKHLIALTNRMELTPIPGKDNEQVVADFASLYQQATGDEYKEAMTVPELFDSLGIEYFALTDGFLLNDLHMKEPIEPKIARGIEDEFRRNNHPEMRLR